MSSGRLCRSRCLGNIEVRHASDIELRNRQARISRLASFSYQYEHSLVLIAFGAKAAQVTLAALRQGLRRGAFRANITLTQADDARQHFAGRLATLRRSLRRRLR